MAIVFDPEKNSIDIAEHGLPLSAFQGFDEAPVLKLDERQSYGEPRYKGWGPIHS